MPRAITPELQAHLALSSRTTAICWLIQRKDGVDKAFTLHDQEIKYTLFSTEHTYSPVDSGVLSNIRNSIAVTPDNLEAMINTSSESLSKFDLEEGLWDNADMYAFLVNYKDLTMGDLKLKRTILSNKTIEDFGAKLELRDISDKLTQRTGRVVSPDCPYDLGDSDCKFVLTTYPLSATGNFANEPKRIFYTAPGTESDNFFAYAPLVWTSGNNNGLTMEVEKYEVATGTWWLFEEMPFNIEAGDTFDVVAGCDKRADTCKTKFNNFVNFGGFNLLPGISKVTYYPPVRTQ